MYRTKRNSMNSDDYNNDNNNNINNNNKEEEEEEEVYSITIFRRRLIDRLYKTPNFALETNYIFEYIIFREKGN